MFPIHDLAAGAAPAAAPSPWPAAAPAPSASVPQFGRDGQVEPLQSTSLWSYFKGCLTEKYAPSRAAPAARNTGAISVLADFHDHPGGRGFALDAAADRLGSDFPIVGATVFGVFMLATLLPSFAVSIRRIHDIGLSGWFYLLILVPYVGSLIIFVFSLIRRDLAQQVGAVPAGIRIPPPFVPPSAPASTPPAT